MRQNVAGFFRSSFRRVRVGSWLLVRRDGANFPWCAQDRRSAKSSARSSNPEDLCKQIFQEIRDLAEKISGEKMELLERKRILEELLKVVKKAAEDDLLLADVGRRATDDTVVAGSGFTRKVGGKVKEQIKQLPLAVVDVPKWRVIFSYVKWKHIQRIRQMSRDP